MMKLRTPYAIAKRKQGKVHARSLTADEIALAKRVFGELIDYGRVRIVNYPYVPWQSDEVFIAPNGFIFVSDKHYKDDYTKYGKSYEQVFVHEMTHVMQYQQGINVLLQGAILQSLYYLSFKRYNPYHYHFDKHKSFWDYNIEQQGRIAEHIYLGVHENMICKR